MPRSLGRYQLLDRVDRGGTAAVYEGRDSAGRDRYAITLFTPPPAESAKFRAEFLRVVGALRTIVDPGIPPLVDSGEEGETFYFVTPLPPANDLAGRMRPGTPREEAVRMLRGLAAGLTALHRVCVTHGELDPRTIRIGGDDRPLVAGAGVSGLAALARMAPEPSTTTSGAGMASYLAPEQVEDRGADARSDVYAFGVIAYELLVGEPPFVGSNPVAAAVKHLRDPFPRPSVRCPDLSRDLERVILRCVEKEPRERYADAGEIAAAIEYAVTGPPPKMPGAPHDDASLSETVIMGPLDTFASPPGSDTQFPAIRSPFADDEPTVRTEGGGSGIRLDDTFVPEAYARHPEPAPPPPETAVAAPAGSPAAAAPLSAPPPATAPPAAAPPATAPAPAAPPAALRPAAPLPPAPPAAARPAVPPPPAPAPAAAPEHPPAPSLSSMSHQRPANLSGAHRVVTPKRGIPFVPILIALVLGVGAGALLLRTKSPSAAPAPAPTALTATDVTDTSVTLAWIAPADAGVEGSNERAARYELRHSDAPFDENDWKRAGRVKGIGDPAAPGRPETFLVSGLAPGTEHWFALRSAGSSGAWSALSNVVAVKTHIPGTSSYATLVVRTRPERARVTVAGRSLRGPAATFDSLEAGEYTVRVGMDGYVSTSRPIELAEGERSEIDVTLNAAPVTLKPVATTGCLRVFSGKYQMGVELDGKDAGRRTPCLMPGLKPGSYTVMVKQSGFDVRGGPRTVTIAAGDTVDVNFAGRIFPKAKEKAKGKGK